VNEVDTIQSKVDQVIFDRTPNVVRAGGGAPRPIGISGRTHFRHDDHTAWIWMDGLRDYSVRHVVSVVAGSVYDLNSKLHRPTHYGPRIVRVRGLSPHAWTR
jgi:hypothetical protein